MPLDVCWHADDSELRRISSSFFFPFKFIFQKKKQHNKCCQKVHFIPSPTFSLLPQVIRTDPIFIFVQVKEYELSEVFHHSQDKDHFELMKVDRVPSEVPESSRNNDIEEQIEEERKEEEMRNLRTQQTTPPPTPSPPKVTDSTDAVLNSIANTFGHNNHKHNKLRKAIRKLSKSRATFRHVFIPSSGKLPAPDIKALHSVEDLLFRHSLVKCDRKFELFLGQTHKLILPKSTNQKPSFFLFFFKSLILTLELSYHKVILLNLRPILSTGTPRDCRVSEWGEWGSCSKSCGVGEMQRRREVSKHARRGGKACPPLLETKWCGSARTCIKPYFNW